MPVAVEVERLSFAPRGVAPLLREVSLQAAPGSVLGVIGPNGAGKSTLLRCLYGAGRPRGGRILVDGQDLASLTGQARARRIAAVPQETPPDFHLTVADVVAAGRIPHRPALLGGDPGGGRAVRRALELMALDGIAERSFATLSGGEKKRTVIARALAQEAQVLVLDEPVNHLDIRHQLDLMQLIRRLGTTTIVSLHAFDIAARFCDSLALLDRGRLIAQGAPEAVLTPALLRAVFEVEARILRDPADGSLKVLVDSRAEDGTAEPPPPVQRSPETCASSAP